MKNFERISIVLSIILISLMFLSAVSATDDMAIDNQGIEEISILNDDISAYNDYKEDATKNNILNSSSKDNMGIESPENKDYSNSLSNVDFNSNLEDNSITNINMEDSLNGADFTSNSINGKSNLILGAGSTKTFTQLAQDISNSNGYLVLSDNYKYVSSDSQYVGGLYITSDLTIVGPATIDGSGLARLFYVANGATLRLTNLNLVNGFNDSFGGAVASVGANLYIDKCNFTSNTIRNSEDEGNAWGNTIFTSDSHVTIQNAHFFRNWFSGMNGVSTVYFQNSTVTVSGCSFTNNTGIYDSGAIYVGSSAKASIINSNFTGNRVTSDELYQCGAIYVYGEKTKLENCTFINNTGKSGGAICWIGNYGNITGCTFIKNTAYEGGAMYFYGNNTVCIDKSTFINNSAQFGGAIRTERSLNVTYSYFYSNKATYGDSGAIGFSYWEDPNYEYSVDACVFVNNSAKSTGNAIDISAGKNGVINNSIFINNKGYLFSAIAIAENVELPTLGANWYGNTIQNYTKAPKPTNKNDLVLKEWLYLNVTNETINDVLTFSLNNLYDKTTGEISNVDNFHMSPINFTFETLGTVFPEVCEMDNKGIGKVQFIFDGTIEQITLKYETINLTTDIEKRPTGPYLRFNTSNIIYGNDAVINVLLENVASTTSGTAVLTFNGTTRNVQITNCKGSATFKGLSVGTYNFSAVFDSDEYGSLFNKNRLSVFPCADMPVNVTVDNIFYGQHLIIDAKLDTSLNNSGSASLIILDGFGRTVVTFDDLEFVNSKLHKDYDGIIDSGNYTAKVIFNGNVNITETSGIKEFRIIPVAPNLTVSVNNISYGSKPVVKVNVTGISGEGLSGIVYVNISNVNTGIYLRQGEGSTTFNMLNVGNYTVYARYDARGNYGEVNASTTFSVSPITPYLYVHVKNINYGEDTIINITFRTATSLLNGTVAVDLNGTPYNVSVTEGEGYTRIPLLDVGTYNVTATYNESGNFNPDNDTCSFKVSPIDPTLRINVDSINYGEDAIVKIKLTGFNNKGLNGTVLANINGTNYTIDVSNGVGNRQISNLNVGIYEKVTAKFNATRNYNKANDTTLFAVRAIAPKLRMSVLNSSDGSLINYGEDAIAKVYLTGLNDVALNGSVLVNINGTYYLCTVNEGVGSTNIPNLPVGDYNAQAIFLTSGNYKEVTNSKTFTVSPVVPSLDLSIDDIVYGDNAIIKVNFTGVNGAKLNGTVIVYNIGSQPYTVNVLEGIGTTVVSGLKKNTYNAVAKVNASGNYKNASDSHSFVVSPAIPNLTLTIDDVDYGGNVIAKVNLTGVNGEKLNTSTLKLIINGTPRNVNVVNGSGILTLSSNGFKVGNYDAEAKFTASGNYLNQTDSTSFAVKAIKPNLTVSVDDIVYGQNATVKVELYGLNQPLNATVNLTIGNKDYEINVIKGKGNRTISNLSGGHYIANVKVGANDKFSEAIASDDFNVNPRNDLVINVNVGNINFGQMAPINVTVSGLNGDIINGIINYRVLLKGTEVYNSTLTVNNNIARGTIRTILEDGNYTVVASFGNDNYNVKSASDNFTVNKSSSGFITCDVESITFGGTEKINVTVMDNDLPETVFVDLYLNGQLYQQVKVVDGKGNLSIPYLEVGNYSVFVIYEKEYESFSHFDYFLVNKANSMLNITGDEVEEGKDATVTVTVKNGTTPLEGIVIVTVNKVDYSLTVGPNGSGTLTIADLPAGNYNVTAKYLGNKNYDYAVYDGPAKIVVESKPDVKVVVSATDYAFNQTGNLVINVSDSKGNLLSGNISVSIDGNQYNKSKITNGHIEIQLAGLNSGLHAIDVIFTNDKYGDISNSTKFNVNKVNPVIQVTGDNIELGDVATVNVTVKCGAVPVEGIAIVTVKGIGHAVTIDKNGKGTLTIPDLPYGQYAISANFLENDNYKGAPFTGSAKIVVSSDLITFDLDLADNNTKIAISNAKDASGKAIDGQIKGEVFKNGVKIADLTKSTLGGGTGTIVIPSTLDVGDYTAQICVIALDGSSAYENISFTINPKSGVKLTTSVGDYAFDETGNLVVDVVDSDGKILSGNLVVLVDGKQYAVKTVSGGHIEIALSKLGIGPHAVEVIFTKPNYLNSTAVDYFNVTKLSPIMIVNGSTVEYGKTSVVNIKVADQKGRAINGTVIVAVDCVSDILYDIVELKNGLGQANFRLDYLVGPGTYNVTATYVENDNYNSDRKTNAKLIVTKSTDLSMDVSINENNYGEDTIIDVSAADGSGAAVSISKVNVTIDGKKTEFAVKNGKVNIGKLATGEKSIVVSVNDGFHSVANATAIAKVNPLAGVKVSADVESYAFNENGTLEIEVTDSKGNSLSGNISVLIDGNKYAEKNITNGHIEIPLVGLNIDEHTVEVIFTNPNYLNSSASNHFNVTKVSPVITLTGSTVKYGQLSYVDIQVADQNGNSINGTVIVTVDDDLSKVVEIKNGFGRANFMLDQKSEGVYSADATYVENDKYNSVKSSTKLTVTYSTKLNLVVTDNNPVEGEDVILTVSATDGSGAPVIVSNVNITINGSTYRAAVKDGKVNIGTLPLGSTNVKVLVDDGKHEATSVTKKVTVNEPSLLDTVVTVASSNIKYGNKEVINFTLKDIKGNKLTDNITVTVGDLVKTVKITNGVGSLTLSNLTAGNYPVVANYTGTKKYGSSVGTSFFNVAKNATMIIFSDMNTTAVDPKNDGRTGEYFYFTLKDANGNIMPNTPMQIGFNGKVYTYEKDGVCTNEKGVARLQINLGYKGDYTFAVCFLGDENHNASFVVAKIKVACQKPNLNVLNKYYKVSDKTKTLTATFKNEHGNLIAGQSVKFTIDGKTYSAKTNDKGVATVKVSLNKKGTYSFVASYGGSSTYSEVTKTATLIIS